MSSNLKKIRDFERMIKRFGSSPELEAKLADAKQGKVLVSMKERTRKNSTKYHMVRFLERKKVTRKVRSLETKLKTANEIIAADLNKQRDSLLNDLAYIMYYPMEHKYVALFPGKEDNDKDSDSESEGGAKVTEQGSNSISLKAREVALQRWADDKQRLADGIEGGGDKVAYAMEVEYKGGAAAAESAPGRTATKNVQQDSRAEQTGKTNTAKAATKTVTTKAGSKHTTFAAETAVAPTNKAPSSQAKNNASDSDSSDSESSSDSSSGSSDSSSSDSDSDGEKPKSAAKSIKPAPKKAESTKIPVTASVAQDEASDNDGDDFFVEEASESELVNAATAPKVYNDGNNFRFKEERKSVHEIRFAATKRKYERHKRVFNNQNKRGANDRGSKKQRS